MHEPLESRITGLVRDLFTQDEFVRFLAKETATAAEVHELPSPSVSRAHYFHEAVGLLWRKGHLNPAFRNRLIAELPNQGARILAAWPLDEAPPDRAAPPRPLPQSVDDLRAWGLDADQVSLLRARGINELTRTQQEAVAAGLLDGRDLVVSAPTSSGKTLVGELALMRHAGHGLTVFLVSHRALAQEIEALLLSRYDLDGDPYLTRVALFTGDRDTVEGRWDDLTVVVATYEKFFAQVTSARTLPKRLRAVVADEFQLLGDGARGPTVELMLARLLKEKQTREIQLLVLSATLGNPETLAAWLRAGLVKVDERSPPLAYEVWTARRRKVFVHVDDEPMVSANPVGTVDPAPVVAHLLASGLGPVAVMATQRAQAETYARSIAEDRAHRVANDDLIQEADQIDPGTARSQLLVRLLGRGVGLHTGDLGSEQRRLVETAFKEGKLDVLVATPTLVAGVNLPIRTVLYPTIERFQDGGTVKISYGEFHNGAGRAGRKGLQERGTVICLAASPADGKVIEETYLRGSPEHVGSRMVDRGDAFVGIQLLATFGVSTAGSLAEAAALTLWGFERELGPEAGRLTETTRRFTEALHDPDLRPYIARPDGALALTHAGAALAATGFEPEIVRNALRAMERYRAWLEGGDRRSARRALLAALCGELGGRELPFIGSNRSTWAAYLERTLSPLFAVAKTKPSPTRVLALAYALVTIDDLEMIPAGLVRKLRDEVSQRRWVCGALSRRICAAASVADALDGPDSARPNLDLCLLAEQLDEDCSERALELTRLVTTARVSGVGPARRALLAMDIGNETERVDELRDLPADMTAEQMGRLRRAAVGGLSVLCTGLGASVLRRAERADDEALVVGMRRLLRDNANLDAAVADALHGLGWRVDRSPTGLLAIRPDGKREPLRILDGVDPPRRIRRADVWPPGAPATDTLVVVRPEPNADVVMALAERATTRVVTVEGLAELWLAVHQARMTPEWATQILIRFPLVDGQRVWTELRRS